jgi:Mg2+/Co2+ transporter CorB
MVPRSEIIGIDLEDDWHETLKLINNLSYTRIPIYADNIDNLIGIAQLRKVLPLLLNDEFNPESLVNLTREGYFIPEGTPLTTQLINFRKNKRRIGFVVDEYGDIQGLVAIEDILEEIVGEFTTDPTALHQDFFRDADGSFLVDGATHIRDINRNLDIQLPSEGPRTLNGLILEHMEFIPESGTSLKISGYPIEIMQHGEDGTDFLASGCARHQPTVRAAVKWLNSTHSFNVASARPCGQNGPGSARIAKAGTALKKFRRCRRVPQEAPTGTGLPVNPA